MARGESFMKALTAPMGWNSWDCYGAAVTEEIVRKNAEITNDRMKFDCVKPLMKF